MGILTDYGTGGGIPMMGGENSMMGSASALSFFYGPDKALAEDRNLQNQIGRLKDLEEGWGQMAMSGGGIGVVVEGLINQTDQLSEYEKRKRLFKMLEEK